MWKVDGPAPDGIDAWFPKVVFYDLPVGADPHFGPFTSWQTNGSILVGSGTSGICGRYTYLFQLIRRGDEGVTVDSSGDPTVDDEGEPPETGAAYIGTPS